VKRSHNIASRLAKRGGPVTDSDSMETLLLHESVNQAWGARDRPAFRATEHVVVTGPSAKEAESWASQPGYRARYPGKPE